MMCLELKEDIFSTTETLHRHNISQYLQFYKLNCIMYLKLFCNIHDVYIDFKEDIFSTSETSDLHTLLNLYINIWSVSFFISFWPLFSFPWYMYL